MSPYEVSEKLPGQLLHRGDPVYASPAAPRGVVLVINGQKFLHPDTFADIILALNPQPRKDRMIPQKYRAYIYRSLAALAPIAVFYGVLSGEEVALFLSAAATFLGVSLAAANTPTS